MELEVGLKVGSTQLSLLEVFAESKNINFLIDLYSITEIYETNDDRYKYNPKEILIKAVEETRETGSSTCVLASLDDSKPVLYTSNLGDSGYMVLRKEGIDLIK